MEFGDLKDIKIQEQLTKFNGIIKKLDEMLEKGTINDNEHYERLTTKERIDYNLFMAYNLNTLYFLYLKSIGQDPSKSEVKDQLNRIRQYMIEAKKAHERNTIRPKLNVNVANRFIKHGIQHANSAEGEPSNKKKK